MAGMIKSTDLARVREMDFALLFKENINKLVEALGVTRKEEKKAGTVLKAYKATGTLESGAVAEGETIPLSKYQTEAVPLGELIFGKWRKVTTAEAITEKGYDQAVTMTTERMLKDVQKSIRVAFFNELALGTTSVGASTFQAVLAKAWGQLQVKFEDDDIEAVYFMNPLDVADYLANATISLQTVFGMTYVENFLGLGTVFFNSNVPQGNIYATAKNNIIQYFIPVNGADLNEAFEFTSDETGLIGIHESADYTNMTAMTNMVSAVGFFAERIDGVIVGIIDATPTLGSLTVNSAAGTEVGDTAITITETKGSGNIYKYKVGTAAVDVVYGQNVKNWTSWDGTADITAETGKKITIVECDSNYRAQAAGNATVTAKAAG